MNFKAQTLRFVLYVIIITASLALAAVGEYFYSLLLVNFSIAAIFFERERTAMYERYKLYTLVWGCSYFSAWWSEYKKWLRGEE
jgi:hypothetical protein